MYGEHRIEGSFWQVKVGAGRLPDQHENMSL